MTKVGEVNPAEARVVDSSRYPPNLAEAGFMQPCPRRIRALRGGETVLDRLSAFYVREVPYHPGYHVPVGDVVPVTRPRTKFHGSEEE